jgi:glycine hydroxymethyltransferase
MSDKSGRATKHPEGILARFYSHATEMLGREDPELLRLIEKEYARQANSLAMVASCSTAHPSVLACEGTFTSNVTAEGFPGARHHAGCKYVDRFEQLAIDRAKVVFGAKYANVQPHSASTANQIVMTAVLKPGDTLLGLDLDSGGHLSHGSSVNMSGKFYNAISYGLDGNGYIDYDQVEALAREFRPKLIISGTTAYPRTLDWQRFRDIADSVGAYLLADITHIAGLVIAGLQPNPIDIAHFTVTCTHKQLYGPRGGLILMGKDWEAPCPDGETGPLWRLVQRRLFPFTQGAPLVNTIVAKARVLARCAGAEFKADAERIMLLARAIADAFITDGATVLSGGTDNHIVLINVLESYGVTGIAAEKSLESCNIIVNKNRIPGDTNPVSISSGIRIGTNSLAVRAVVVEDMKWCANLIGRILRTVEMDGTRDYSLPGPDRAKFLEEVTAFARRHPLRDYPTAG